MSFPTIVRLGSPRPSAIIPTLLAATGFLSAPLPRASADIIADSNADWSSSGTQGENDWTYGYRDLTTDGGGDESYNPVDDFILFPGGGAFGVWSDTNHWTGSAWDFNPVGASTGNPPWSFLAQTATHPNGTNRNPDTANPDADNEHWVIRRWDPSGEITEETALAFTWTTRKTNGNGGVNGGVTGGVYMNGLKLDAAAVGAADQVGVTRTVYANVFPTDIVDLVLTPVGPNGNRGDGSDGSANTLVVDNTIPSSPIQPDGRPFIPVGTPDTDMDNLPDTWEAFYFPGPPGGPPDLTQLAGGQDFDMDGADDDQEFVRGSDPTVTDTDMDGLTDGEETSTGTFVSTADTGSSPLLPDTDGDGIGDFEEVFGMPPTNPNLADSDMDGFLDPVELAALSDPNDLNDTPNTFVVADSVADFSGVQEQEGWSYGYYDLTNDGDGTYATDDLTFFPRDPMQGDVISDTNFWDGTNWDWFNGNPPWTLVGPVTSHPNSANQPAPANAEHWAIKRWEASGLGGETVASLIWSLAKTGVGGNGVTGYVFVNGVQVDRVQIAGNDTVGVTDRRVWLTINDGDIIDLALSPEGYYAREDGVDSSNISLRVDTRFRELIRQPDGSWFAAPGFTDTEPDGLPDAWEELFAPGDLDAFSTGGDADMDTLLDEEELARGTDPTMADTDMDGFDDVLETRSGIFNGANDPGSDPLLADTDGDTLNDFAEVNASPATDPNLFDTDFDRLTDNVETNTGVFVGPTDTGTNPTLADTDMDTVIDGTEVNVAPTTNPLLVDTDDDGLDDAVERAGPTNAAIWDTDFDGFGDGEELDAGFVPTDRTSKPGSNVIASSQGDFSTTGDNPTGDWTYGYRNRTVDGGGQDYDPAADLILFDTASHWTGNAFDLGAGAPWTVVNATGGHPNGTNNVEEHWAIYRWTPPFGQEMPVLVTYTLAKQNTAGGDGTSVGLYLNGTLLHTIAVAGNDGVGTAGSYYLNVDANDVVDLALKPQGPSGLNSEDGADGSFFGFVVDDVLAIRPRQPDGSEFIPAAVTMVPFVITGLDILGFGEADITWNSVLGRTYRVETSRDLVTWITLQSGIVGTAGTTTIRDDSGFTDPSFGGPAGYYRVVEE